MKVAIGIVGTGPPLPWQDTVTFVETTPDRHAVGTTA